MVNFKKIGVMSIAERKEKIITAIQALPEEKLNSVEAFIKEISGMNNDHSIDFIYNNAVEQYHDALLKLAQ